MIALPLFFAAVSAGYVSPLAYSAPIAHHAPLAYSSYSSPLHYAAAPVVKTVASPIAYHAPLAYHTPVVKTIAAPIAYHTPIVKTHVPVATSYANTYKVSIAKSSREGNVS